MRGLATCCSLDPQSLATAHLSQFSYPQPLETVVFSVKLASDDALLHNCLYRDSLRQRNEKTFPGGRNRFEITPSRQRQREQNETDI